MRILCETVLKALLNSRKDICTALLVYIWSFHHRRQVSQAGFTLGKSILAISSQVIADHEAGNLFSEGLLYTFGSDWGKADQPCSSVNLPSCFFGIWTWFAIFHCLIDSREYLPSDGSHSIQHCWMNPVPFCISSVYLHISNKFERMRDWKDGTFSQ